MLNPGGLRPSDALRQKLNSSTVQQRVLGSLRRKNKRHKIEESPQQDSAVHLHQKVKGHSFKDASVYILDREDRWFERRVKEAIYIYCERSPLNRVGDLRQQLSASPEICSQELQPRSGELNRSHILKQRNLYILTYITAVFNILLHWSLHYVSLHYWRT